MKLKNVILPLVAVAMLAIACKENKKVVENSTLTLNGAIANDSAYNGQMVYLQKKDLSTDKIINIDSTKIESGKFSFKDSVAVSPSVGLIAYSGSKRPIPFIMEAGTVELAIDSTRKVTVKGTKNNDDYQQFIDQINAPDGNMEDFQAGIYNYTKANINNAVGEYFLMERGRNLNAVQLKELLTMADSKVNGYQNYKALNDRLKVLESVAVGQMYTDLKGLTPEGKEIALSEYVGKGNVILLDFWASWCPPCRAEMPALVELYKQYKDKGFQIVGISIDDDNTAWQKGITDLNITWPQMSDLKGRNSVLSATYGVTSIPQTYLLDKDGKIIASGFNAEQLAEQLKELLN